MGAVFWVGIGPVLSPRLDAVWEGSVPDFGFGWYPAREPAMSTLHTQVTQAVALMDPDAIVFANWYWLYPYLYAAHVEQGRLDLTFLEQKPHRAGAASESSMLVYVAAHAGERPVYFQDCLDELREAGYRCFPRPVGMTTLYRVRPGRSP